VGAELGAGLRAVGREGGVRAACGRQSVLWRRWRQRRWPGGGWEALDPAAEAAGASSRREPGGGPGAGSASRAGRRRRLQWESDGSAAGGGFSAKPVPGGAAGAEVTGGRRRAGAGPRRSEAQGCKPVLTPTHPAGWPQAQTRLSAPWAGRGTPGQGLARTSAAPSPSSGHTRPRAGPRPRADLGCGLRCLAAGSPGVPFVCQLKRGRTRATPSWKPLPLPCPPPGCSGTLPHP
jgi:hypothetical protein